MGRRWITIIEYKKNIHLQEKGNLMNYQDLLGKYHTQRYNKSRTDSITGIYQPIEAIPIPQLLRYRANKGLLFIVVEVPLAFFTLGCRKRKC